MSRYPKPTVCKLGSCWMARVTRGFSGNYEYGLQPFTNWRDAFDWAHNQVKDWNPLLRDEVRYR